MYMKVQVISSQRVPVRDIRLWIMYIKIVLVNYIYSLCDNNYIQLTAIGKVFILHLYVDALNAEKFGKSILYKT